MVGRRSAAPASTARIGLGPASRVVSIARITCANSASRRTKHAMQRRVTRPGLPGPRPSIALAREQAPQ
jgi:hypothetical protein